MGSPVEARTGQLAELIQAVEDLQRRVAALEQRSAAGSLSGAQEGGFAAPEVAAVDSANILAALGRLLLGIAGAYLLRAITEATLLPQLAGAILGLVYAVVWLVSAGRVASRNRMSAGFQAFTAALVAGPLLWEATVRFHSLAPIGAAVALALFIICGQLVAWRAKADVVAGVAALAGSVTAIALIVATLNPAPFAIAILTAAAVIEFGAVRGRAVGLRWMIAAASDFCAFLILYVATRPQLPDGYAHMSLPVVISIPIALAGIYVASTVTRTLVRGARITGFEIAQAAISVALALGCGLGAAHGAGTVLTGAICLFTGLAAYAAVLLIKSSPRRNFHVYATFALLLVTVGSSISLPSLIETVLWSAFAVAATAFGESTRANTFRMHGAFFLCAAAWAAGVHTISRAMIGSDGSAWPPSAAALVALTATVIAYVLVLRLRTNGLPLWTPRVSAAILVAILCWGLAGIAAGALNSTRWDAQLVSTLRMGVIAAVAIALAWFGRRRNVNELIWILSPWMIFGALKLAAEDFRQSRPATLFLSLLLYGGTLIALPRLLRRSTSLR